MLKNYLKIGWRNLWKNKLTTVINLVGLTLGISVCVVILIFARYESTFDAYHAKSDQTFRVVQHTRMPDQTLYWNTTAYALAGALRDDFPELDVVTQIVGPTSSVFEIQDGADSENLFEESNVLFVDRYYPEVFDVTWLAGDTNTALNDMNSIVLTETLAQKYFDVEKEGYRGILGKILLMEGKDPLTITGVVENPPGNSEHQYGMLLPYEIFKVNNPHFASDWAGNHQGTIYVVLNNPQASKSLESKIENWKKKYLSPQDDKRIDYQLQPLEEIHNETLYGQSPGGYIMPKHILSTAVVVALFILLIAIVNFINLITAQSRSRLKEVGVRKVMGSNRFQLMLQFLYENGLIILLSSLLSVFAVQIFIQLLNDNSTVLNLQMDFNGMHLAFILLIACVTILLAAVYPALVLSAFKPIQALKGKVEVHKGPKVNTRRTLVTFQFIIVQVFVIAAIILAFQMGHIKNSGLGFEREAVVITEIPDQEKLEVYRDKLLADGGISKVSFGSGPPMAVNGLQLGTNYRLPEQSEEESMGAEMKIGDVRYLDFYNLELLAGRNFLTNKEAFDEFIVNETFLKSFGWNPQEAIGKKVQINEGPATIVGVVKDFHNNSLQHEISPCIIVNWTYLQFNAFIKLADTDYTSLAVIEKSWKETFSNAAYDFQFLDDAIEREYTVENMIFNGFGIFSLLAIIIGCLGLFGLMSFIIAQKRKEIGIRKVLGASLLENVSFFAKEYTGIVSLAFLIASPLVYYFMHRWLQGFTYRIDLSLWMFLIGGAATFLIAMLTCSYQSIRAAMASPINALRDE
ncbi:MAG: ABC transporter permease [Pricia sp.]